MDRYTDTNYKGLQVSGGQAPEVPCCAGCHLTAFAAALLQATFDKYRKHGFTILGFPCNQVCVRRPSQSPDHCMPQHPTSSTLPKAPLHTMLPTPMQFGRQEPGSEAEIHAFCTSKYHVGACVSCWRLASTLPSCCDQPLCIAWVINQSCCVPQACR
jgi:hypothetical protein